MGRLSRQAERQRAAVGVGCLKFTGYGRVFLHIRGATCRDREDVDNRRSIVVSAPTAAASTASFNAGRIGRVGCRGCRVSGIGIRCRIGINDISERFTEIIVALITAGGGFKVGKIFDIIDIVIRFAAAITGNFINVGDFVGIGVGVVITTGSGFKVVKIVTVIDVDVGQFLGLFGFGLFRHLFLDLFYNFLNLFLDVGEFFLCGRFLDDFFLDIGEFLLLGLIISRIAGFLVHAVGVGIVVVRLRKGLKGSAKGSNQIADAHGPNLRRRNVEAGNRGEFRRRVHDLDARLVHNHDFADEAVALFHEDNPHIFAIGNFDTHLGAADTDGRHRGRQRHGVRIGLGDLTTNKGKHALHDLDIDGTFLRAGVVDHFVQHHAAVFRHREGRFVRQNHADGAVGGSFKNIALINRIAHLKLNLRTVGAGGRHRAAGAFNRTDRLGTDRCTGIGNLTRRQRPGQLRNHIAFHLATAGRNQLGRVLGAEISFNDRYRPIGRCEHQIVANLNEFTIRQGQTFGENQ